jgi:hypothetical protein
MVDAPQSMPLAPTASINITKEAPRENRVIGLKNAEDGVNPKDRVGSKKIDLTLIPFPALLEMAKAQTIGGPIRYGEYNWRKEPVQLRTYLAAMYRHIGAMLEGELVAEDSGVMHLGHIMACAGILIDAHHHGKLIDNGPVDGMPELIDDSNDWVKERL